MIYYDNNATTRISPQVLDAMKPFMDEAYANPNASHQAGVQARAAIEKARGVVAKIIKASPSEIVFTGCGSESNNQAILGSMLPFVGQGGNIVISAIEHSSVKVTAHWVAETFGFEVRTAPFVIRDGVVDVAPFLALMDDQTRLVSVMFANNETGVVMPISEIFGHARARGIRTHADAVQGFGKMPVDVTALNADVLSFSAHKFHGPKGAGGHYVRRGVKLPALVHGGGQENGHRSGTESVADIVAVAKALALAANYDMSHIEAYRDAFEQRMIHTYGDAVRINFSEVQRTPNCSSICFLGQNANMLLIKLDQKGVATSTGSACNSGALTPSKGLLAAGFPEDEAAATLRFSFSKYNTQDELDRFFEVMTSVLPAAAHA